jgi:hypothetical protein
MQTGDTAWRSTEIPGDRGDGLMDSGVLGPRHDRQDLPAPLPTVHRLARGSVRRFFCSDRRKAIDLTTARAVTQRGHPATAIGDLFDL